MENGKDMAALNKLNYNIMRNSWLKHPVFLKTMAALSISSYILLKSIYTVALPSGGNQYLKLSMHAYKA